eukprot:3771170-Pleurochrysis_carterae.AAC.1
MRACLAMCVGRLVQPRKASTFRIVWVNESVDERTHQCLHRPTDIHHVRIRLHVAQQIGAHQLA